tara:strand:+ start:891 stop:1130 length:240 start_codon:yes stop_codon:yes gene_type:complete
MTDQEIVKAITNRKEQFVKAFPQLHGDVGMDSMYFNHICTVLDHASKIMNVSVEDMTTGHELEQEIKSAEIAKKMKEDL